MQTGPAPRWQRAGQHNLRLAGEGHRHRRRFVRFSHHAEEGDDSSDRMRQVFGASCLSRALIYLLLGV